MMNIHKYTLATLLTLFSLSSQAVTVIVHPSNTDEIDTKLVKKIYLGKTKKFPSGGQVIPLELDNGDTKEAFLKSVVGKSESQYKAYWSKLVFTGKGQAPRTADSDNEVIELVSKNPNLIGYISDDSINDSVKSIGQF